jgi:hypothetical protein
VRWAIKSAEKFLVVDLAGTWWSFSGGDSCRSSDVRSNKAKLQDKVTYPLGQLKKLVESSEDRP